MGRIVWAQLQVDDRRTLSCGVPFRIQPFHRLKLELPQGTEAWGAVTTLHFYKVGNGVLLSPQASGRPYGSLPAPQGGLQEGCRAM